MKKYIVDRIEEGFVVLQDEAKKMSDIPKNEIPDAKEGDIVIFENGRYRIDAVETQERKEFMTEKMKRLLSNDK